MIDTDFWRKQAPKIPYPYGDAVVQFATEVDNLRVDYSLLSDDYVQLQGDLARMKAGLVETPTSGSLQWKG